VVEPLTGAMLGNELVASRHSFRFPLGPCD
jgi:hypothetical protein